MSYLCFQKALSLSVVHIPALETLVQVTVHTCLRDVSAEYLVIFSLCSNTFPFFFILIAEYLPFQLEIFVILRAKNLGAFWTVTR